jgi:hypothetical protein
VGKGALPTAWHRSWGFIGKPFKAPRRALTLGWEKSAMKSMQCLENPGSNPGPPATTFESELPLLPERTSQIGTP